MPVLSVTNPNLLDWAKRLDPDGTVADIVELLKQQNEVLDYIVWKEGNLPTGHRTTVRTGLPSVTWRKLYGGVQPSRSITAQVTETCGMLEAYAEVDKALADLNGNTPEFRLSEDSAFLQAMSHEFVSTLIYGNEALDPAKFTGLAARYNTLSSSVPISNNVLSAGGSGANNTSIWLVVWGDNIHGIFPKGSKAGIQAKDLGEVTVENVDGQNGRAQMYRTHYKWTCGLVVRDWRYALRIANVNVSDLINGTGTQALTASTNILRLMTRALDRVHNIKAGKAVFMVNRTVREALRVMMVDKSVYTLSFSNVGGEQVMTFGGVPVVLVDALLNTEAAVV